MGQYVEKANAHDHIRPVFDNDIDNPHTVTLPKLIEKVRGAVED